MDNFLTGGAALFSSRIVGGADWGDYFASLPEEVQEAVNQRAEEFHSVEEMKAYAEEMKLRS